MARENTSTPKTASNHLNAYTVEEYEDSQGKTARRWTRIGAAFPHKEGAGLNVELRALPVDGRIVLLPPDPEPAADAERAEEREPRSEGRPANRRR